MNETKHKPIRISGIRIALYKIILILFVVLYYFKADLDYGFGNFLEKTIWAFLALVIILEAIKIVEQIKSSKKRKEENERTHASSRVFPIKEINTIKTGVEPEGTTPEL